MNRRRVILLGFAFGCALFAAESNAVEIDFDTQIVPVLSKAGCNAASCHGSAAGQSGFRLSLFGGDPEFDYRTIVRELSGRRVNHAQPLESLVIAKPTGQLDHGGGDVLDTESDAAKTIRKWIAAGSQRLQLRQPEHLDVSPKAFVTESVPATIQIKVTVWFDDGLERDVTDQAVYVSQNEAAVTISNQGKATVTMPGQHSAIVRFCNLVTVVSFISPVGEDQVMVPDASSKHWIDKEVNKSLSTLRLLPAATISDVGFLRRLSLDLTGRLPRPKQVMDFVDDHRSDKRSRLIDELLDSPEFIDYWTHLLAKQLRFRTPGTDGIAANAFYAWLRQQVADDSGWNEIATSLINSEGDTHQKGAATVHRFFATARDEAEYMSEVLMGVRLRCANCHNHPLDQWTQDDYHGLAAIFAPYQRGKSVRYAGRGEVIHPRTGLVALPRIPGRRFLPAANDNRGEFTDWLVANGNPYFAKAMVGRIWQALVGQGLVAPVDDLRATNPASHPELMDRLSGFFAENGFKLRPLIRIICNSDTYQRSREPPAKGTRDSTGRFYQIAIAKPLSAEVLADAISDVCGVADDFDGVSRAIMVVDRAAASKKLQILGQCSPGESCSSAGDAQRGIATKLYMMNGDWLNTKLAAKDGRLGRMLGRNAAADELVREFYLRTLCRLPSDRELADWISRIETGKPEGRAGRCEDFVWALLNCHEFTHNH